MGLEAPEKQTLTVLFIDDEQLMRDVASMMFEDVGWEAHVASSGKAGVELYEQHQNEIDLAIIDFSMPEMNGLETAQAIRAKNESAKIIMISGLISESDIAPLKDRDAPVGFLAKPFHFDDLVTCVKEVFPVEAG